MKSNVFFLGWDVGPWKCTGKSKDGLQLLKCDGVDLSVVGRPFHGNLLNEHCNTFSLERLLAAVEHPQLPRDFRLVLAVDAVFGWPKEFRCLVEQQSHYALILGAKIRNTENKYLYRETERFLDSEFDLRSNPPMTAVGGAIGSAATKAQFCLSRLRATNGSCYVPPLDGWNLDEARNAKVTIIEVYPGVTRKSRAFQQLALPNGNGKRVSTLGNDDLCDSMRAALVAACYANMLEMIDGNFPEVYVPTDVRENGAYDYAVIQQEGWIFTPKKQAQTARS